MSVIKTLQAEIDALNAEVKPILKKAEPLLEKIKALEGVLALYKIENGAARKQEQKKIDFEPTDDDADLWPKYEPIFKAMEYCNKASAVYKPLFGTDTPTTAQKNKVSAQLNTLRKAGKIERYKLNGNNNLTYWGLKKWFYADGTPKEQYKNKSGYNEV